jgi:hypothetical protein
MGTPDVKPASKKPRGETTMIRKLVIALGATAILGAAALAPTAASANWKGKNWHHSSVRILVAAPDCYYVKRAVLTKHGLRIRYIQVCDVY